MEVDVALSQDDARSLAQGKGATSGSKDNRNLYLVCSDLPRSSNLLLHIAFCSPVSSLLLTCPERYDTSILHNFAVSLCCISSNRTSLCFRLSAAFVVQPLGTKALKPCCFGPI